MDMDLDLGSGRPRTNSEITSKSYVNHFSQSQSPPAASTHALAPVAKRKPHSKSRLGCQQCKQRKVKCDETKPSCKKCVRNDTECSFINLQPNIFRPTNGLQPVQKPVQQPAPVRIASASTQSSTSTKSVRSPPSPPARAQSISQPQPPPQLHNKPIQLPLPTLFPQRVSKTPDSFFDSPQDCALSPAAVSDVSGRLSTTDTRSFDLLDMQLYHHYMMKTSLTMCETRFPINGQPVHSPGIKAIWHNIFSEMAFNHDFLMHILLSLSAFHMSSLQHHRKGFWMSVKTKHQELGISSFRFAVANMNKHNVHACWAFSLVLALTERPGNMCDFNNLESGMGFISLIRGGMSIYDAFMPDLFTGPMSAFFQAWGDRAAAFHDIDLEDVQHLDRVADYWSFTASDSIRDQAESLQEALDQLKGSFATYASDHNMPELGPVMAWPAVVSDTFMQMVLTKHTGALIIMAHFCVLISRLKAWWLENEAVTQLRNIMNHISDADMHWISWPMKQVFYGNNG